MRKKTIIDSSKVISERLVATFILFPNKSRYQDHVFAGIRKTIVMGGGLKKQVRILTRSGFG